MKIWPACLALLLLVVVAVDSSAAARTDRVFSAVLRPGLGVSHPGGTRDDVSGRFIVRLDRRGRGMVLGPGLAGHCVWGCRARYRLAFSHLTGPPTDIVIRFGRPDADRGVWHRLCSRYGGRGNCPPTRSGSLRGTFGVDDARAFPREIYIQISTKRNPLGEIRGQIKR